MKYRSFGRTGWNASALAFGCMRLPCSGGPDKVDEALPTRMIRTAIDAGVNYIDTAYTYQGGKSEVAVGKALKNGYRQKVKLADKMPMWLLKEPADLDRIFNEQLSRLQTDHIDLYLLHSLNRPTWKKAQDLGVLEWAERQVSAGRIQWIGFSFHDELAAFKEIVDGWEKWTFCMIFYNYASETVQAGTEGLHHAASKGLAVSVMEPLMGGNLVNPPPVVKALWEKAPKRRTPADWALQWVWNKPEVSTVLSGMSSMAQVQENLASAERSAVGSLSAEEVEIVSQVGAAYETLRPIPCTQCGYCMPCPSGVNIPRVLDVYNKAVAFCNPSEASREFGFLKRGERAGACTECQECEGKCPQEVPVHEWMKRIAKEFGG
jgi:hypothetical protein